MPVNCLMELCWSSHFISMKALAVAQLTDILLAGTISAIGITKLVELVHAPQECITASLTQLRNRLKVREAMRALPIHVK